MSMTQSSYTPPQMTPHPTQLRHGPPIHSYLPSHPHHPAMMMHGGPPTHPGMTMSAQSPTMLNTVDPNVGGQLMDIHAQQYKETQGKKKKTILRLLNFDQMLTLNTQFQTAVIIFYFCHFSSTTEDQWKQEHKCEIMGSLKTIYCPCKDPLGGKKTPRVITTVVYKHRN